MEDSLIPIVLAILAFVISAISQSKKKKAGTFMPPVDEDSPAEPAGPLPDAEVILRKILQDIKQEAPAPPVVKPVPQPVSESLSGDLSVPEELKRQRDLLMAVEGIHTIPTSNEFAMDEIHDDIASSQISDPVAFKENQPVEIAGVGTWDLKKAVIFSEIINKRPGL